MIEGWKPKEAKNRNLTNDNQLLVPIVKLA